MQTQRFGILVAAAVANMLSHAAYAEDSGKKPAPKADAAHCVHDCSGYAECKGHGNNSCKGKNDCAGQGKVPKACSSQTSEEACKKVVDTKKNTMCTWFTES